MSNFLFENEAKVRKIAKEIFLDGEIPKVNSVQSLMVHKYILCYQITGCRGIKLEAVERLKRQSLDFDASIKNRIFFEKAIYSKKDFIFFKDYMQSCERNKSFLSTWWTWFAEV